MNEQGEQQTAATQQRISTALFALIVTGIFAVVAIFGLVHHEMWRDELQAWLVARDAHSLPGLLQNMKYEGNPALWHFFLFLITMFTHNPVSMQVFHLIIACGFIFVFNRYSTLDRRYNFMFSFGYFTAYEYSIISRSYGMAVLLIMIACALYRQRYSRYILLGVVLALLANVTGYGIVISGVFAGVLAIDYYYYSDKDTNKLKHLLAGIAIVAAGILFSIYQVLPEPDNSFPVSYADGLFQADRWGVVFSKLLTTYFYIPRLDGMNFWNTNCYFDGAPQVQLPVADWLSANTEYLWFWFLLPLVTFLLSVSIFLRKPLILLLYAGITLGLLFFYYYTNLAFSRYCGFLVIILIVGYWLEQYYPEKQYHNSRLAFLSGLGKKIQTPFLVTVLAANMIGAAVAYSKDYSYEFSPSHSVAKYIRENKLDTMTVSGANFYIISPLAAYLDTQLYYFQMNDFGSFCVYNSRVRWDMPVPEINNSIMALMKTGRSKLLVVSSYEWTHTNDGGAHFVPVTNGMIAGDVRIRFLQSFAAGIVPDEEYYVYLVYRE